MTGFKYLSRDALKSSPYDEKRSDEWSEWVESDEAEASREKEIYPRIRDWLGKSNSSSVVEVGCGQGIISKQFNSTIKYIGIDPSDTLINRANHLYASENHIFIKGDAYNLPLEDANTEAALSVWVWSHLQDLQLAADEMARVLKPNGAFLIINANPGTYEERKGFYKSYEIVDGVLVGDFDLGNDRVLSQGTLHFHSLQSMLDALSEADLRTTGIETLGHKESYPKGLYIAISGYKQDKGSLA